MYPQNKLKSPIIWVHVKNITELAAKIAAALSGKSEFLLLEIDAYAQAGLAQEVYPSEELVLDKGKAYRTPKQKADFYSA